jgi:hypothetical protein
MKINFVGLIAMVIILVSCKKTNDPNADCGDPDTLSVVSNSPVVVGWPIEVSAGNYIGTYDWVSPSNSPINQSGFVATNSYTYYKSAASFSDSGLYRLEVNYEGCLEYKGSTQIKVIPPPVAPCNITSNTSTSSVVGVGGTIYTSISFGSNGTVVQVTGNGETMNIRFYGSAKPRQGIYKTNGYNSDTEKQVGCWITKFPYDFINQAGQDIYVNTVNGKMQISFCNCQFTNPLGSTIIRISAKITEP